MEELSLLDCLQIIKKRRAAFLLTFAVIFATTILFVLLWSNYRSIATIEIEQPQVASDITTPMGMSPNDMPEALADLRINRMAKKITSPATLVDIITKYDLYPSARTSEPMASVAERMASKINLKLIGSDIANPAASQKVGANQLSAIAFTFSFDYSDPQIAQNVLNELVTRFLDEDLKDRKNSAEVTSKFIEGQIKGLEDNMAEQDKKIADFEKEHGIVRPETLMFNQQASANVGLSLQALDSQIASNEGMQGTIRAQLATVDPYSRVVADGQLLTTPAIQLKALQAQYSTLTAQYGPEHPDVLKIKSQMQALQAESGSGVDTAPLRAQIADIKTNIKAATKTYGAEHPDVAALKQQLASLETQLAEARKSGHAASNSHADADNPAYLQFVAQLRSAEEQHKTLLEQREKLQAEQEKYQQAVLANPELQQQMAALTRDRDSAQIRYRELKSKKMAADMDVKMIEDRNGERLSVINPPQLPQHTHPQKILIILAGFLLSCMGGIVSVIIHQMINQSIVGARHMTSLTGVAPLVSIPHITTEHERNNAYHTKLPAILRNLMGRLQLTPRSSGQE